MGEKGEKKLRALSAETQFFGDLPYRVLLDTTVFLRALWPEATDDPSDVELCRDFFRAMDEQNRMMLMGAPSVAEIIRGDSKRELPRSRNVVPVAFDHDAAIQLGRIAPATWLRRGAETGVRGARDSIRYDTMLCGCALRANAMEIIALDRTMARGLPPGTIKVTHPIDYVMPTLRARYGHEASVALGHGPAGRRRGRERSELERSRGAGGPEGIAPDPNTDATNDPPLETGSDDQGAGDR